MTVSVAILDYEAGNVRSAQRALVAAGADARITSVPEEAAAADALVIPGVGHFRSCLQRLVDHGLEPLVRDWIARDRHLFGICVGMQLLYETSEEGGADSTGAARSTVDGLGLLPGRVRRLETAEPVPHMGWDVVRAVGDDPLLAGLDGARAYFVHAYYAEPTDDAHVVGTCTYGGTSFPCVARHGNVVGTQFHPEKSGAVGARLLASWVAQVQQPVMTDVA